MLPNKMPPTEPKLPRYLYRFVRYERLCDILTLHRLYVPSTSQLNDPFECIVKLDTHDHGEERRIQKNITARARVLSFSGGQDSAKNILMWSHYADSHRGACLQFDTRKWDPRKNSPGYVVRNVRYSMKRPLVSLSRKAQQHTEPLNKIAFTKHKNWSYEQEWRMVCSYNGDVYGDVYLEFPEEALTAIIFGLRMSEPKKELTKTLVAQLNLGTTIKEACEDAQRFRVRIAPRAHSVP